MQIEQKEIKAQTRKLKARWSIEAQQDLESWHGGGEGLGDRVKITVEEYGDEIAIIFEVEIDKGESIRAHTIVGRKSKRLSDYTGKLPNTYTKDEARLIWDILVDAYHCRPPEEGSKVYKQQTLETELMDIMAKEITEEIDQMLVRKITKKTS